MEFEKNVLKEVINNDSQLFVINSDPTFNGKRGAIVRLAWIIYNRRRKRVIRIRLFICG